MKIPFTKAHGAHNDFLLTWRSDLSEDISDLADAAKAICDRHTGAGADGWLLISPGTADANASIELWNSDGSRSEMSGNGTRCAAALLVESGLASDPVCIVTGAGPKTLRLLSRQEKIFSFEMNMGKASISELHTEAESLDATLLNVGNPQCAVFVSDFDFDWPKTGAVISTHPRFPQGTNVSFVKPIDDHTLDVRFVERGAGETMSSGTGSTGAGAAAFARGLVASPVTIKTPAGPLVLRWESDDILLAGPAEIVAAGEFYYKPS